MTDSPLSFAISGVRLETPDLARFLTAQSGVEMLDCLKRNFFHDEEVPVKWEFGVAVPIKNSVRTELIEFRDCSL